MQMRCWKYIKKWIPQLASPEDDDRRGLETCITVLIGEEGKHETL